MLQVPVVFRKLVPSSHVTQSALLVEPVVAVKPLNGQAMQSDADGPAAVSASEYRPNGQSPAHWLDLSPSRDP
jgi:hypothetical protein